uniref:Mitochondrial carrier protein n=1 Tax=Leptocylindrus danicus TaxID=163516 RepID=A0A7S2NYG8_9STRA|mmetsp:Transcript_17907/g.26667  ORF Transcript_17907/g.26667 Transcript_17907/m.26667 type:complete len:409 (+) Transcript_17907:62-1288(+)|eukprot:CAMPEP_0116029458 /NCGR_PEP_ID=MMETSP0321-20121206/16154_1 /TAXON_ID=163516 /ORGANISM="Leptocylindrus danicus var. danicus, Strain B650" /LENGTH=408 /DNA_ID=CAMNT_0003503843 /DNA_START=79 /DNA_END=1305 /DNA_ORIENTATION=-
MEESSSYWSDGNTKVSFTTAAAASDSSNTPKQIAPSRSMVMCDNNDMNNNNSNHQQQQQLKKKQPNNNSDTTNSMIQKSIAAGSFAGISSTLLFHPLDVVRTKMQSEALSTCLSSSPAAAADNNSRNEVAKCNSSSKVKISRGNSSVFSVVRSTIQYGGIRAFYTGLSLPLAAQAVYKSCVFTTNSVSKAALMEWKRQERHKVGKFAPIVSLNLKDVFFCGALGGLVNAYLFVTPVEYVRNQLIAQDVKLAAENANSRVSGIKIMRGPIDVIRRVVTTEGMVGLWRGAGVTVMRDSLGCGFFFVSYEVAKRFFSSVSSFNDTIVTLLSGSCAGIGFWVAAAPLDTIKTNIQTGNTQSIRTAWAEITNGGANVLKLYSGWQVAFGRGAPAAAVTVYSYEMFYSLLEKSS